MRTVLNRLDRNPANQLQAAAAARGQGAGGGGGVGGIRYQEDNGVATTAILSRSPPSLEALWDEYMNGLGGAKAARLFTSRERGMCKFKYSRRKIFWDLVARQVSAGRDALEVIQDIRNHYGAHLSVSAIINKLRQDRGSNTLPAAIQVLPQAVMV